ncbi:MAG: penicillin-binding transpeptidase domain-containing protein, partial [Actinomycetota bacterium]|nr:penicillin-binding transpeptidase domain-containing protein [Actinomycetota bacterium]
VIPKELDPPSTAQSAIGARDVQATALQMAMVASATVIEGVLMRPYVVAEVLDASGRRVKGPDAGPWVDGPFTAQAVSETTATALADLMVKVVQEGTGTRAQIPGVVVGGKTGTADPGEEVSPHVWFVGFASTPGPRAGPPVPRVAVAVVLPNAGRGLTGGRDAAPIAKAVMQAALEPQ